MADISSVFLVGRLSRESQIIYGSNGVAIVRFGIAVNRPRKASDGSWEDETSFFDCVYLGRGAESVNQYLEKGRQVSIMGDLRQSRWIDKTTGKEQRRVEVVVNTLSLGSPSKSSQGGQGLTPRRDEQYGAYDDAQYQNQGYSNNKDRASYNNNRGPQQSQLKGGPEEFSDDSIPF